MKKILFLLALVVFTISVNAQITDTASLRTAINTDIVTNATKSITAEKLNRIFIGNITAFSKIGVTSISRHPGTDSVFYTKNGVSTFAFKDSIYNTITLQQAITAGATMTGNNTIAGGGYNFNWTNAKLGIGTSSPDASSIVDITSTTKGLLIPRMTKTQIDAISSPATGLHVFSTTDNAPFFFDGSSWVELASIKQQAVRTTSDYDKTSSTTLSNITDLAVNVVAGKTYQFVARLFTNTDATGGVKFGIGGTCVVASIIYDGIDIEGGGTTTFKSRATSLGDPVGGITLVTEVYATVTGTVTVGTSGTLTVMFAQNASSGATSTVMIGSTFIVTEIL